LFVQVQKQTGWKPVTAVACDPPADEAQSAMVHAPARAGCALSAATAAKAIATTSVLFIIVIDVLPRPWRQRPKRFNTNFARGWQEGGQTLHY
jgi:hypothetical protein